MVASCATFNPASRVKLKVDVGQGASTTLLIPMASTLPAPGDFTGLALSDWERQMVQTGYEAVSAVEGGWEFLKTYEPPADQGFMFSEPTGLRKQIDTEIETRYGGHSGASYGMTMRVLERIAKQGWEVWAKEKLPNPDLFKALGDTAQTVDSFLTSVPPSTDLKGFADAIQQDAGMRKAIPDIDQQADALRRFADGKMSYAEMRTLCG